MNFTQDALSAIIQAAGMINPSFKMEVHEHTPNDLVEKAKNTFFTDWFKLAYILLNDGFLSMTDNRTSNEYKVTLSNIKNGLGILMENYPDIYKSLSESHYYPKYADYLLQCSIFGEVTYKWSD